MSFAIWNQRIADYFFGDFAAGVQVRLAISRDVLDNEFADIGGAPEFLRTVKKGPDWPVEFSVNFWEWNRPHNFFDRAMGLYRQWKFLTKRHTDFVEPTNGAPPFLPYLGLLCYSWTVEGADLAGHNFYDRLEQIYPHHRLNQQLGQLGVLWDSLQQWTVNNSGRFGIFTVEQLGAMQHVGVPKAQVILTAARIERLPMLFSAIGLFPQRIQPSQLRLAILDHEGKSRDILGNSIFQSVQADDPIGKSAVEQLVQQLEQWDGIVSHFTPIPHGDARSIQGQEGFLQKGYLQLAVMPTAENEGWEMAVCVITESLPGGTVSFQHDARKWIVQLIDSAGGPVVDSSGREILNGSFLLRACNEDFIEGAWVDEIEGERKISLYRRTKPIHILRWQGPILVERASLPGEGDAYLLVSDEVMSNLVAWKETLPSSVVIREDLPQHGLPHGWRLLHISGLGKLEDLEWGQFPDGGDGFRPRPKALRLLGGSRARRTGIRRAYLPFDPPRLIVEAEGEVQVHAVGASLIEDNGSDPVGRPDWAQKMPGKTSRLFHVQPTGASSVISIWATIGYRETERLWFGLATDSQGLPPAPIGDFRLNEVGTPSLSGVIGAIVALKNFEWEFQSGPTDSGQDPGFLNFSEPFFQFLDWLANQGRVPFTRARDLCLKLLRDETFVITPSQEFRALWQLGHLEIQTDLRGRWAYVHATPCILYPLPIKRGSQFQVIVGGTYSHQILQKIFDVAKSYGVPAEAQVQLGGGWSGHRMVAPRICLLVPDLTWALEIAQESGVNWTAEPPSASLSEYIADLGIWEKNLQWFSEIGPPVEATYRPTEFRTRDGDKWLNHWSFRLGRLDDAVTQRHFSYFIANRAGDSFRHVPIAQKAWGCWHAHRDAMHALAKIVGFKLESIPIAYETDQKRVVLPVELDLPILHARALTLCSGFAPSYILPAECGAYSGHDGGFTPGAAYHGPCVAYRLVPEKIAKTVLDKMGAFPRPYSQTAQ